VTGATGTSSWGAAAATIKPVATSGTPRQSVIAARDLHYAEVYERVRSADFGWEVPRSRRGRRDYCRWRASLEMERRSLLPYSG
jgi:hypothetical protein